MRFSGVSAWGESSWFFAWRRSKVGGGCTLEGGVVRSRSRLHRLHIHLLVLLVLILLVLLLLLLLVLLLLVLLLPLRRHTIRLLLCGHSAASAPTPSAAPLTATTFLLTTSR